MNLLYIVFVVDSKLQSNDGRVFRSLELARDFVQDCIMEHWGDKFIIGMFLLDGTSEMLITSVETYGFATKVKKLNQLSLFNER